MPGRVAPKKGGRVTPATKAPPRPRAPQTPPRGSSPLTAPGGTPPQLGGQLRPPTVRPGVNPLIQALLDRMRAGNVPQMGQGPQQAPEPSAPVEATPALPPPPQPTQARTMQYQQTPQPPGAFLSKGAIEFNPTVRGYQSRSMIQPVLDRIQRAYTNVTAPERVETAAPTANPKAAMGTTATTRVLDTITNPDGSEDWLVDNGTGAPQRLPKTRTQAPSPITMLARTLGETAGIALEGLGLPAKGTERVIGEMTGGANQISDPVVLPGGKTYYPAGQQDSLSGVQQTGLKVVQGLLGILPASQARPENFQSLDQATYSLYGDTPQVQQALSEVTRMTYSGPDNQLRAVARMVELGQDPTQAIYGDATYVEKNLVAKGYLDDPVGAIKSDPLAKYVYDQFKAQGKTDDEIVDAFNTQGLPGEENIWAEAVAQTVLDPLNLLGGGAKTVQTAIREKAALRWFGPSTKGLEEVVSTARAQAYATSVLDPLSRTPTAVTAEVASKGEAAVSHLLATLSEQAGKADELGNVRPGIEMTLQAYLDSGQLAPKLENFVDEAGKVLSDAETKYAEAFAQWEKRQATARQVLAAYPVATSDAGKLGAALTRSLGRDMVKNMANFVKSGKPAYEFLTEFMPRYEDAAKALIGAGRETFERGIPGLVERAAAGAKLSPVESAVAGFVQGQRKVNSALWKVFAEWSPAYSARNASNNLTTAIVDGVFTTEPKAKIMSFLDRIGLPPEALKGISVSGAEEATAKIGGGFAGNLKVKGIPVGAQAVEEEFSKRAVYKAAKDWLDKNLIYGKAIPELPDGLRAALGDDLARGLQHQLAAGYGDLGRAKKWLVNALGTESVRIAPDAAIRAAAEFEPELADRLLWAMDAATPEEFAARLDDTEETVKAMLGQADAAVPTVTPDEVMESLADDAELARELGANPVDEAFQARVTADRLERDRAYGTAFHSLQGQPTADNFNAFQEVQKTVGDLTTATRKMVDDLRNAAWAKTRKIRAIAAQGSWDPDKANTVLSQIWKDYFEKRNSAWTKYRDDFVSEWSKFSEKLGVQFERGPSEADQIRAFEQAGQAEALRGMTPAVEIESKLVKKLRVNLDTATVEGPKIAVRVGDAGAYSEWKGYKILSKSEKANGWKIVPAHEADVWVEKMSEQIFGDPSHSWQEIEQAVVNQLRREKGLAELPTVPKMPAVPEGPPLQLISQEIPAPAPPAPKPIPSRWTPADPRSILGELKAFRQDVTANWNRTKIRGLDPEQTKLLDAWLGMADSSLQQAKAIAGQVGVEARNFALLNYSDRRNIDTWLSLVFPYHYWYTRTYANWAQRAVWNPAAMATYGRYRDSLGKMHAALPEYWQQQLSTDDLGLKLDTPLMFNLEATLSPLYGILGTDFTDPDRRRATLFGQQVGGLVEDLSKMGPTVWAPLVWAMSAETYLRGDSESASAWLKNYVGNQGRTVRAATALVNDLGRPLGVNPFPAGGLNLDPQLAIANMAEGNGLSVTGMTEWERQRVAKVLTSYLSSPPAGTDPKDWQAKLAEAAYLQKGELWDKAMQQSIAETAPQVIQSYFLGLGFKGRGEYENEFSAIWAEQRKISAQRGNWTPEEMAQAYIDLRARHPMYDLLMLSRASGPERDDTWVWDALGRVGIANSVAWESAGVSKAALDQFYKLKTVDAMDPELRAELLAGATAINAVTRPKTPEEARRQLQARQTYLAVQADLAEKFPPAVFDLQEQYYQTRDELGPDAAKAMLDNLPDTQKALLFAMWDAGSEGLAKDPLAARYYIDPERYQNILIGRFYDSQDQATVELARTYSQLNDIGRHDAAKLLLGDHPELKDFWDARDKFYTLELPQGVQAWLSSLPDVQQAELRQDVEAGGKLQTDIIAQNKEQEAAYLGVPTGDQTGTVTGGAKPGTLVDQYVQMADQEAAAQNAKQTYLTAKNKYAYGDRWIQNLIDQYGPDGAINAIKAPIAQAWPDAGGGTAGVLAFVGKSRSLREALLTYAGSHDDAGWARVIGWARSLTPQQVAELAGKYPALSDLRMVSEQARKYNQPTLEALNDILGMSVSFREDGTYTLSAQSAKKPKTGGGGGYAATGAGGYGSKYGEKYVTVGDATLPNIKSSRDLDKYIADVAEQQWPGVAKLWDQFEMVTTFQGYEAGKAFWDANPQLAEYDALRDELKKRFAAAGRGVDKSFLKLLAGDDGSGGGGGGGGGGSRRSSREEQDAARAEEAAHWLAWFGDRKRENPTVAILFQDYLDLDPVAKQVYLQQHPELMALLQALGPDALARLEASYAVWREMNDVGQDEGQSGSYAVRAQRPRILRVYGRRPSYSGLNG